MLKVLLCVYGLYWFYRAALALSAQNSLFCLLLLVEGFLVLKFYGWLTRKKDVPPPPS